MSVFNWYRIYFITSARFLKGRIHNNNIRCLSLLSELANGKIGNIEIK